MRIGCNPHWQEFFAQQTVDYDYTTTRYQLGDGLDCSGYLGWCLYNIFQTQSGGQGYVMKAEAMAAAFAGFGWGALLGPDQPNRFRPGNIMSMPGHVWLSLGACTDGSVVFLHSSPCGVQIGATPTPQQKQASAALELASYYMARYFPLWHQKYPCYQRGIDYLRYSSALQWRLNGKGVLLDPEGYAALSPVSILQQLLGD